MYNLLELIVWQGKSNAWKRLRGVLQHETHNLVISKHRWYHLKDDIYDNLPRREAARALKIIYQYEEKYMTSK